MKQHEKVIKIMENNGGFATLGFLYQNVLKIPSVEWRTKTPFASMHRIVQVFLPTFTTQTATLEYEKNYETDRFGRLNAYMFIDNQNFNVELVKNGLAEVVIYDKRRPWKYQEELLSAQDLAKQQKIGIWSTLVK